MASQKHFTPLLHLIESTDLLPEQKNLLFDSILFYQKQFEKLEFKLQRTLKDKEIAINLLNASLENLEAINHELMLKNEEIQQKNAALEHQSARAEMSARQLELHLRELTYSYESLEQFSNIASHDLKTPLRNIAGYAQLLQRRYHEKLDHNANEFISYIVEGVRQMNDIISKLHDFTRSSLKNQHFMPVSFDEVCKIVLDDLKEEIYHQQADIILKDMPVVFAIKSAMIQLFSNLISNALKFRGTHPPRIEISAEKKNDRWHFYVSDNGIGIDPQFAHKIFMPFQRLHNQPGGKGIGLAICKKIVQLHHGEIWHEARQSGGSIFHFTIPLVQPSVV